MTTAQPRTIESRFKDSTRQALLLLLQLDVGNSSLVGSLWIGTHGWVVMEFVECVEVCLVRGLVSVEMLWGA